MLKVSIILPTYNSSLFIERTIISVINQTFKNWELLVIDDQSSDNTVNIIKKFIENDSRIKIFETHKNSGGPATPKNIGINNATGEYVAFLDHDDEWIPKKLEKQIMIFNKSTNKKLGLVSCYINVKNNKNGKKISKYNKFYKGDVIDRIINGNFIYTSSSVLTKLSILKEVGTFDNNLKTSDDWDMWIRISEKGYDFTFIPEYLLNYYTHKDNACYGKNNFSKSSEFVYFFEKHKDIFIKNKSLMVGYNLYLNKKYVDSRKYYIDRLIFGKLKPKEIMKTFGFIILSYLPSLEKIMIKIWRILN